MNEKGRDGWRVWIRVDEEGGGGEVYRLEMSLRLRLRFVSVYLVRM